MTERDEELSFLRAIARWRKTGAPAPTLLGGLTNLAGPSGVKCAFQPLEPGALRMAFVDVAVLSDIGLSLVARQFVEQDHTIPTMSLTIQIAQHDAGAPLEVTGTAVASADGYTVASAGPLLQHGQVVGHLAATFAKGRKGASTVSWEKASRLETEPVAKTELSEPEEAAREIIARGRGDGRSWIERLFEATTNASGTQFDTTPLLTNRAGGVQGGMLMAFAELAARRLANAGALTSIHMDFIAPGAVGPALHANARVLRQARRSVASQIELRQESNIIAVASTLHRC